MPYQHLQHAGNFADIIKHTTLALLLEHMCASHKAVQYTDTHAGNGLYSLEQATPELAALLNFSLTEEAVTVLQPYLNCIKHYQHTGISHQYPGSPLIATCLLQQQGSYHFFETDRQCHDDLLTHITGINNILVHQRDGFSHLLDHETSNKTELILIDPPFVEPKEFQLFGNTLDHLSNISHQASVIGWFPLLSNQLHQHLLDRLNKIQISDGYILQMPVKEPEKYNMYGCGLVFMRVDQQAVSRLTSLFNVLQAILCKNNESFSFKPL